jgi:hypothetical protein
MKMSVSWVVVPYSQVEVYQRFRDACCLHHQGDGMMAAASTSVTSINFYQITRRNDSEGRHHQNTDLAALPFPREMPTGALVSACLLVLKS